MIVDWRLGNCADRSTLTGTRRSDRPKPLLLWYTRLRSVEKAIASPAATELAAAMGDSLMRAPAREGSHGGYSTIGLDPSDHLGQFKLAD